MDHPLCDTHTHTARCGHAGGADSEYIEQAMAAGLAAIAVTDHLPFYWLPKERHDPSLAMSPEEFPGYVDTVLALKERYRGKIEVLLGVEADFIAGCESELAEWLARYPFDVVLGSVHWLDGWWVDAPSSLDRYRMGQDEVEAIWSTYTSNFIAAARSGLFDVLTHIDLPKKFGFRSKTPFAGREDEVIDAIVAGGSAVELSSAGRRKVVGEDYPAPGTLHALVQAGVGLVFSSDAHAPAEVGFAFSDLCTQARGAGAKDFFTFRKRQRQRVSIPDAC